MVIIHKISFNINSKVLTLHKAPSPSITIYLIKVKYK